VGFEQRITLVKHVAKTIDQLIEGTAFRRASGRTSSWFYYARARPDLGIGARYAFLSGTAIGTSNPLYAPRSSRPPLDLRAMFGTRRAVPTFAVALVEGVADLRRRSAIAECIRGQLPEIETIQVHHFRPGRHEVVQELLLRIRASIHFG
jgi:hypothetical protein